MFDFALDKITCCSVAYQRNTLEVHAIACVFSCIHTGRDSQESKRKIMQPNSFGMREEKIEVQRWGRRRGSRIRGKDM